MMKKVWNRFIAFTFAGLATVGMLAGCGSKDADIVEKTTAAGATTGAVADKTKGGETVIRVCWWGNQTRNDGTVKALEMYEAEHPGIKFEVEFSDFNGYWDKLATQAAGGNLPDIIQMDYRYIKQYADKGQIVGLNQYINSGVIDTADVADSIMETGEVGSDIYGIVSGTQAMALLVNTDVMAEAGVTLPKQPTWDELFEAGKIIHEKTGQFLNIPSGDELNMLYMARAVGQTMFNEAGDGLGMPDETVALRYFTRLKETLDGGYHLSPEEVAEGSNSQLSNFAAGKEWCNFINSNQITNTISQCPDGLKYEIYMYPTEADVIQQPLFLKPSMFWSISKDSGNSEIAADVINYLTNSVEANKEALKGERGVPVSSVVSEAIAGVVDESTARINSYVSEVAKIANKIDPPYPAAAAEVAKLISDLSDMVRYEEITPADAAHDFYEQATEILQKGASK